MLKRSITYVDYNDKERTEDFYFNLSNAELTEMEFSHVGGLDKTIEKIIETKNNKELIILFKDLVLSAYGEKTEDGRRFVKSQEVRDRFAQSEAYSVLFMELATDENKAAEFVNAIVPKGKTDKVIPVPQPVL